MKFTLNEKYILDEAKFVLNERFILTEAVTAEEFKTNLNKLKEILNSEGYDTTKLNTVKTADNLNEVKQKSDAAIKSGDIGMIKGAAQDYIEAFKKAVPDWSSRPNIADTIKKLQDSVNSYNIEDIESDTELTSAYKAFSTAANDILSSGSVDGSSGLNASLTKYEDTIKKIAALKDALNTEKSLNEIINNATASQTNLEQYNKIFIDILNKLPKEIVSLDLEDNLNVKDTSTQLNTIIAPINKFVASLTNLNKNLKKEKDAKAKGNKTPEKNIDTSENDNYKDWAAKYDACKSQQDYKNFWDEYFNSEWGEYADKADSLGYAFVQELEALGFDKNSNPFIGYLKENERIKYFDEAKYSVLHNAVANNLLTLNDLSGKGKLGMNNVIFLQDWLSKPAIDMENYLERQKNVQSANLDTENDVLYRQNPGVYVRNLLTGSEDGKGTKLLPVNQIDGILRQRLASDNIKAAASMQDIENGLAKVTDENLAKKYLAVALPMFMLDNINAVEAANKKVNGGIWKVIAGIAYEGKDVTNFISTFGLDNKDLTPAQITTLLVKLAVVAKAKLN